MHCTVNMGRPEDGEADCKSLRGGEVRVMTGREPSLLDQILADFDEMGLELDEWLGDGESGSDYARLVFWAQLFAARRARLGDLSGYQKMGAYIGAHGLSGPGKHLGAVRAIYLKVQAEWPGAWSQM